jgi:hypothetical protein
MKMLCILRYMILQLKLVHEMILPSYDISCRLIISRILVKVQTQ